MWREQLSFASQDIIGDVPQATGFICGCVVNGLTVMVDWDKRLRR
jgi:hypothetical protein